MLPPRKKPRRWLLSVVSAGALAPGCAQDHDSGDEDETVEESEDNKAPGLMVLPDGGTLAAHDGGWAGTIVLPDSGRAAGTIVLPDSGTYVPPHDAGQLVGTVVRLDAGGNVPGIIVLPTDGGPGDAGERDACEPLLLGIVATPDWCKPYFPGVMVRNGDESD